MAKGITPLTTSVTASLSVDFSLPVGKNTLTFVAEYAKDYKGEKPLIEGTIHEVATDVAELFVKRGYGKIV